MVGADDFQRGAFGSGPVADPGVGRAWRGRRVGDGVGGLLAGAEQKRAGEQQGGRCRSKGHGVSLIGV